MTLRQYDPGDLEAVLDVWERASRVAHAFLHDDFFARERRQIADHWIRVADTTVYEHERRVVGFVAMIGNEVGALFVDPDNQRRGVGRALIDCVTRSHPTVELDVFEANVTGRAFYDAYGFRCVGRSVHEETGQSQLRLRYGSR